MLFNEIVLNELEIPPPLIPFPPQEFFAVKFSSKYKKKFSYQNIFVAISLNWILSSPIMALHIVH